MNPLPPACMLWFPSRQAKPSWPACAFVVPHGLEMVMVMVMVKAMKKTTTTTTTTNLY